jgi:hypothetical protein
MSNIVGLSSLKKEEKKDNTEEFSQTGKSRLIESPRFYFSAQRLLFVLKKI